MSNITYYIGLSLEPKTADMDNIKEPPQGYCERFEALEGE
jgi:hypothetical protein